MTEEKKPELSPEELAKAAGGFTASGKRGKEELSQAELERASGAGKPSASHQASGRDIDAKKKGEGYGTPDSGNMHGRTTSE